MGVLRYNAYMVSCDKNIAKGCLYTVLLEGAMERKEIPQAAFNAHFLRVKKQWICEPCLMEMERLEGCEQ